ncbi:MAG: pseudouridine synthase [Imperialibacter sp.]|uniref:pseudouridine synthase n=1 Tax=Imperialibacter sp. TaxID=2038411 RepID=UPI003A86E66F
MKKPFKGGKKFSDDKPSFGAGKRSEPGKRSDGPKRPGPSARRKGPATGSADGSSQPSEGRNRRGSSEGTSRPRKSAGSFGEKPTGRVKRSSPDNATEGAFERTSRFAGKPKGKGAPKGPRKGGAAGKPFKHKYDEKPVSPNEPVRLNKYLANAGIASRREADRLIEEGKVTINGKVVTELGLKVGPKDVVKFDGRVMKAEKLVYLLLNKPRDFITTVTDPQNRKTVMKLVANACEERIYPVGRLDRNTSGLLLFTNDGELAKKLSHPSHMVKKIYYVELNKPLKAEDLAKIKAGLELQDGLVQPDDIQIVSPDSIGIGIEIHVGRNRIVRRIFEYLGYDVVKLDRVMYGGLTKKDLTRGTWRMLTKSEINMLKNFT